MTEHRELSREEILMMTLSLGKEDFVSDAELDAVFDHLRNRHSTVPLKDEDRSNLGMDAMKHLWALKQGEVSIEDL